MANNESWLIFVDTNVFLDFYRLGGESAQRQLEALERHKDVLITGDQIRMEFLKNRQKVIADSIKQITKPGALSFPPIIVDSKPVTMLKRHLEDATKKHKKVMARVEAILNNPAGNDNVFKSLNKLFDHNSPYNLRRPSRFRFEIRALARKRFVLGYPPRKAADTFIGDAVNWEWVVHCATHSQSHHVLIVSRDGDYGITYGNDSYLNDWLRREFKERVGRLRKIELTGKLTVALKRLDEVVSKEDEDEENKIIGAAAGGSNTNAQGASGELSEDDLEGLWKLIQDP